MKELQDKVVLVTGAGAGIGRATALAMAEAGATGRGGRYRSRRGAAHRSRRGDQHPAGDRDRGRLRRCRQHRRDGRAHRRRIRPARRHRQQCRGHPLRPDHGSDRGGLGPHPPGQRQGRVLLPATRGEGDDPPRRRDGSSTSPRFPGRGYAGASNAAYAASKGAVIALTKTAAQQLGRHNINVNAICPGVTRTELGARNAVTRAAERGITVRRIAGRTGKGHPDRPRQHARRTSPRWRCSSPRPVPATSPAKPITSTADWCRADRQREADAGRPRLTEEHFSSSRQRPGSMAAMDTGCRR